MVQSNGGEQLDSGLGPGGWLERAPDNFLSLANPLWIIQHPLNVGNEAMRVVRIEELWQIADLWDACGV